MNNLFSDIEKMTMTLRAILNEAPKRLESNLQAVDAFEKEIMDIEHVIELTNFNASKGYILAKDIQIARKNRRKLKDEIEQLTPIVEVIKKLNFKEKDFNKAIGDIRRIKKRYESRSYKMRIRQDLQHEIDQVNKTEVKS